MAGPPQQLLASLPCLLGVGGHPDEYRLEQVWNFREAISSIAFGFLCSAFLNLEKKNHQK